MIILQRATFEDCRLVYKWRNDPVNRNASFSSSPIGWEEHQSWFTERLHLSHPESIWIGLSVLELDTPEPVGAGRILLQGEDAAVISISVSPSLRGQGIGKGIVSLLRDKVWEMGRVAIARVKPDNEISLRLFTGLGFVPVDSSVQESTEDYVTLEASP